VLLAAVLGARNPSEEGALSLMLYAFSVSCSWEWNHNPGAGVHQSGNLQVVLGSQRITVLLLLTSELNSFGL
jgi:hypothetical protein